MSQRNAGDSTDDSYEVRRRRREQARVHARALARDESWEEVYTADVEDDEEDEDNDVYLSGSQDSGISPTTNNDDLLAEAIAIGNRLARSLPANEARQVHNMFRSLRQFQEELGATGEHAEFNDFARRRWRERLEARTTSPSMNNDESSSGESGDSDSESEATTTVPHIRQHDSSDSEQSTAVIDSRYDQESDSDTSTYDRELYGLTRANLNFEGSQAFRDQYIRCGGRLIIPRRTQSVRRSSGPSSRVEDPPPSHGATSINDPTSTQSFPAPSLIEILNRLGLPLTRAIRLLDHSHHSPDHYASMPSTQTILEAMLPTMPATARSAVGTFIDQCNAPRNRSATEVGFNNYERMERDIAPAGLNIIDILALHQHLRHARIEDIRRTDSNLRAFEAQLCVSLTDAQRLVISALNYLVLIQLPTLDRPLVLSDFLLNSPGVSEELRNDLAQFVVVYHQYPDQIWNSGLSEPLAVYVINVDEVIALLEELNGQRYNGEALRAEDGIADEGMAEGRMRVAEARDHALAVDALGEVRRSSQPRPRHRQRISEQDLHSLVRALQDAHRQGEFAGRGACLRARNRIVPEIPLDAFIILARSMHNTRRPLLRELRERLAEAGIDSDMVRELVDRGLEDERVEMRIGYHG